MANPEPPTTDLHQKRLTLLNQKLTKLYEQYDLETDAARKFQVQHLIKETEAEIQGILHSLGRSGQTSKELLGISNVAKATWIGAVFLLAGALTTDGFNIFNGISNKLSSPFAQQIFNNSLSNNFQAELTIDFQKSAVYQKLINQRNELQGKFKQYPDDADFRKKLVDAEAKIKNFERDMLQLAATINSIPRDIERLQKANEYFKAGEFDKARAVLKISILIKNQDILLRQKNLLETQLTPNANELILLAQATAVDYKSGEERITKTQGYFEQALKSDIYPTYFDLDSKG